MNDHAVSDRHLWVQMRDSLVKRIPGHRADHTVNYKLMVSLELPDGLLRGPAEVPVNAARSDVVAQLRQHRLALADFRAF